MAGPGIGSFIRAQMLKRAMRGTGRAIGRTAGGVKSVSKAAVKTVENRRLGNAVMRPDIELFESRMLERMSVKERANGIKKIQAEIRKAGARHRVINPIVLERLSLFLFPALEQAKATVGLNEKQTKIVIQNVLRTVDLELMSNRVLGRKANIPAIDGIVRNAINEIIYNNLPRQ